MATLPTGRHSMGRAIAGHGREPLFSAQTRSTATGTARVLRDVDAQGVDTPRIPVGGRTGPSVVFCRPSPPWSACLLTPLVADLCGARLVEVDIGRWATHVGLFRGLADVKGGERRLGARGGRDVAVVCVPSTSAV
jgi:hypothetical protein